MCLDKYDKKLSLLAILTHGDEAPYVSQDRLIAKAANKLNDEILESLSNLDEILDIHQLSV